MLSGQRLDIDFLEVADLYLLEFYQDESQVEAVRFVLFASLDLVVSVGRSSSH
jgi:hypothetical protein